MPDYGLLETDGKEALTESSLSTESYPPDQKPMVELPVELQKPVFSDITKFHDKYLLATTNRGIWSFDGKTWDQINHNGKGNANKLCCNSKHCYAYSSQSGVYEILENIANLIIDSQETKGLKHLSICDEDTLLLLYNDGKVKKFSNGELELIDSITRDKYIDKDVKLRFSSMCESKTGICNKCAGELFYKLDEKYIGLALAQIPDTMKLRSMKGFHNAVVEYNTMDVYKAFYPWGE
jgi:hypothetical protein